VYCVPASTTLMVRLQNRSDVDLRESAIAPILSDGGNVDERPGRSIPIERRDRSGQRKDFVAEGPAI
jgi:hypothetical protein